MKEGVNLNSEWRKVASTVYKKPIDSKIFGETELDVTELEKYISKLRKKGIKATPTHFFSMIISKAMHEVVPEMNTYCARGKILPRKQVDAMVSILQADGGMSSVKIENANELSLSQIVTKTKDEIVAIRTGKNQGAVKSRAFLASIPWPFRDWFFSVYTFFTIKMGLTIPALGMNPDSFGSFILTNIGSIGLDKGYPALMPSSNLSFVAVLGGIQKKPVVINDEIQVRRMMNFSVVIDHRIADASSGGKLLRYMKESLKNLDKFEV